jgi:hypothetical protein
MSRSDEFVADFGKNSVDAMLKMEKWRNEKPATKKRVVKKQNTAGITIPWRTENG